MSRKMRRVGVVSSGERSGQSRQSSRALKSSQKNKKFIAVLMVKTRIRNSV